VLADEAVGNGDEDAAIRSLLLMAWSLLGYTAPSMNHLLFQRCGGSSGFRCRRSGPRKKNVATGDATDECSAGGDGEARRTWSW
jgi:hypothetical protein